MWEEVFVKQKTFPALKFHCTQLNWFIYASNPSRSCTQVITRKPLITRDQLKFMEYSTNLSDVCTRKNTFHPAETEKA